MWSESEIGTRDEAQWRNDNGVADWLKTTKYASFYTHFLNETDINE